MGSMIRVPKIGALQFVVLKPALASLSIVVYVCGLAEVAAYQWGLIIIYNISYSTALYAFYLIYYASHAHESLKSKNPLLKFVTVKTIVFLTFWQALFLPLLRLPGTMARWQNFILALEMVVFSLLMSSAFSWREFHSGLGSMKKPSFADGNLIDLEDSKAKPQAPQMVPEPEMLPEVAHGALDPAFLVTVTRFFVRCSLLCLVRLWSSEFQAPLE